MTTPKRIVSSAAPCLPRNLAVACRPRRWSRWADNEGEARGNSGSTSFLLPFSSCLLPLAFFLLPLASSSAKCDRNRAGMKRLRNPSGQEHGNSGCNRRSAARRGVCDSRARGRDGGKKFRKLGFFLLYRDSPHGIMALSARWDRAGYAWFR